MCMPPCAWMKIAGGRKKEEKGEIRMKEEVLRGKGGKKSQHNEKSVLEYN